MIKVSNVTKTFDDFKALDDMSLEVEKGSVYGLVGPNGAGKTTIIKNICGIYKPDSGEIKINDEQVFENTDIKDKVIYISDELFFFSTYSIKDTAKLYAQIYPDWSWERYENMKAVFKIDEKRTLVRVELEDTMKADEIFSILMGENVEPRRDFIEKNAKYVTNLDI